MMRRSLALAGLLLFSHHVLAIPIGYRYIGSRIVSEGRHVYWYWNADFFQLDSSGRGFVAQMYARNLELDEARAYVAIIRCESRTYRRGDSKDPFNSIEEGDPVYEVWRAGCDGGRAVALAKRIDRLNGVAVATDGAPERADASAPVTAGKIAASPRPVGPDGTPPSSAASAAVRSAPQPLPSAAVPPAGGNASAPTPEAVSRTDERRVDSCIRFTEGKATQFGDAAISNTCNFAVEVVYCYKGGRRGTYDCPAPPRTMRADSLGPGATHKLPEYKRGSNTGLALVACKGAMGTVIPLLNAGGGKTGCS